MPTITTKVDGVPLFEGKYGVVNGRYAVKISEFLNVPQDANFSGANHVQ